MAKDNTLCVGIPTNEFTVDMSKPGGRAFVAAVEGVAGPEHANPEDTLEAAARELFAAYVTYEIKRLFNRAPDSSVTWEALTEDEKTDWRAVARKAKELFSK